MHYNIHLSKLLPKNVSILNECDVLKVDMYKTILSVFIYISNFYIASANILTSAVCMYILNFLNN